MGNSPTSEDRSALVRETQALWNAKAEHWDARMGDGNAFQRVLIGPACERLLAIQPEERVLDLACGNGVFARRLAALGARVVAVDFSERFLELARARSASYGDRIVYRLVDVTDETQLLALSDSRFDAAVCNMALMDMPVIDPLLRAVRQLLVPAGRFVFSVQHPAFNSNAVHLCLEEDGLDGTQNALHQGHAVPPRAARQRYGDAWRAGATLVFPPATVRAAGRVFCGRVCARWIGRAGIPAGRCDRRATLLAQFHGDSSCAGRPAPASGFTRVAGVMLSSVLPMGWMGWQREAPRCALHPSRA